MAEVFLGLGSNVGDRRQNLEEALVRLGEFAQVSAVSSLYETPALLPPNARREWNRPFFNLVAQISTPLGPRDLLIKTQAIEKALGRVESERWAPRTLDIDLLIYEGIQLESLELGLPHPRIAEREFVLDPLAELSAETKIQGERVSVLARRHRKRQPRLMGILNLTPDSFSDGGLHTALNAVDETLERWDQIGVAVLDLGAESTRPGSERVSETEEWTRLRPALDRIRARYRGRMLKPKISVDTYHVATAIQAIEMGADIVNDVSGLQDPKMIEVLRSSRSDYVLMHSLSVPANAGFTLPEDCDPVEHIKQWMETKLIQLEQHGIPRSRIICDPGIGFGKTSIQSLTLLQRFSELESLGCRLLSGHSRKSFLKDWTNEPPEARDLETLGISMALIGKGVDLLRVHDPVMHHRAHLAWRHTI